MMSLSKIFKQPGQQSVENEILITRPGLDELVENEFQALDTLWQQPGEAEYTDALQRLETEIEQAQKKGGEMVAEAQSQVDAIEKEAKERGFSAGMEEAKTVSQKELQQKKIQIEALLQSVQDDRKTLHDNYQKDIIILVKTMVGKILSHEVSTNPKVIEVCLKTAMSYIVENSKVKINLHPTDLNRLKEVSLEDPDFLSGANQVEMVESAGVSEGGCLLETRFGKIDATLESRKDRLFDAIDVVFKKALDMGTGQDV